MRSSLLFLLPCLAIYAACDDDFWETDDVDTSSPPAASCPTNMVPTSEVDLWVSTFLFDGFGRTLSINPSEVHDGQYAACVEESGAKARLLLHFGDIPYAWLTLTTTDQGTYPLNDGAGSVHIRLVGEPDGPTYGTGQWTGGSWLISDTPPTLSGEIINAAGLSNGYALSMSLSYSVGQP